MKNTFCVTSIPASLVSEIGAVSLTGVVQQSVAIDETHHVANVVFHVSILEERARNDLISDQLKLCMQ